MSTLNELKNAKYLIKHDGRKYEIDHISKYFVFFKSILDGKDYLGHPNYHLNKRGLCPVSILDITNLLESGKYSLIGE